MIYENSRYEFDPVVQVIDHNGDIHPAIYVAPDVDQQRFSYALQIMQDGTRIDAIAAQVYNDPEKWWIIARANPELFYPDDISMGTFLRIPYAT